MEKEKAFDRMIDYIDSHMTEPITLHELSAAAGFSPWYCSRIFREFTGKTPFEYIRAARVSFAAMKLRNKDIKVIDVAFDFVFDTHEGFTRAFSKYFGIAPKKYQNTTPPIKLFLPFHLKETYRNFLKGEFIMKETKKENVDSSNPDTVFVQVIERPSRKLILKRGKKAAHYFEYCEEVGCDIWGILVSIKEALYEPVGLWLPQNMVKPGTSVYAQGVEVPTGYSGIIPDGFDCIDLKPCKMMIFQGPPYDDRDFEAAISNLWSLMKRYDPELYGFQWADNDAPRIQLEPQGYRGYIEGRPVRQIPG